MPIQLDRILADIAEEKALHPNFAEASKKDVEDAWTRVGKANKLSVHEARSIFKVLQKKYDQEKNKETSSWKLFGVMEEIHRKEVVKPPPKEDDADIPMEEDEEYEMLEVQEEEEHAAAAQPPLPAHSTSSVSDNDDSPSKSLKSNSCTPEKDEKPLIKTIAQAAKQAATAAAAANNAISPAEEKKLLNTMASASPRLSAQTDRTVVAAATTPQTPSAATAAALQKKGITMKKTTPTTTTPTSSSMRNAQQQQQPSVKSSPMRAASGHLLEVGKTIRLPESIKRKLSEDHAATTPPQAKKISVGQSSKAAVSQQTPTQAAAATPTQHTTTTQLMQVKHDREDQLAAAARENSNSTAAAPRSSSHGINLITIPANPTRADLTNGGGLSEVGDGFGVVGAGPTSSTAATVASTSTNGFSPRIEEIDFRNDIIFDAGTSGGNSGGGDAMNGNAGDGARSSKIANTNNSTEIINLGNFDNSLPPTFFKNLCNSSRHEALGLYVANVMNRLRARSAAKLELGILRAIIDVQSDELEQ